MERLIVTLDGPAGSGKSTVARLLARRLGVEFLDTGAMYRGITAWCLDHGIDTAGQPQRVAEEAGKVSLRFDWTTDPPHLWVQDRDMTGRLRAADTTAAVSDIAGNSGVRKVMVELQRKIGREHPRLVTEGRDQGSVVFPDAQVKFYLDASPEVRAKRRTMELRAVGQEADEQAILDAIIKRDERDRNRADGPLVCPPGAVWVDTSGLTLEEVVDRLVGEVGKVVGENNGDAALPPAGPVSGQGRIRRFLTRALSLEHSETPVRLLWWHVFYSLFWFVFCPLYLLRVRGAQHVPVCGRPVLLVSNHQSFLDPIVIGTATRGRPFISLAKASLFRNRFFGGFIRSTNAIPVERGAADLAAMRRCVDLLRQGRMLLVFPEGTRTPDGTTKPFAPGTLMLIRRARPQVVPVAVEGAYDAWPRKHRLPRLGGRIAVMVGRPIDSDELLADGPEAALKRLRDEVEGMRLEARRLFER
ncbi:MAG: (d)CMP kinase [Phycisphaeraceae bacterium]|nr:(d)CMP kinase [Phycisphaeraceae bacterium]